MCCYFRVMILATIPFLLCGFIGLQKSLADTGVKQEKPAKEPDAADIAKWVKELGDPVIAVRDQATKKLEAIGIPALEALREATKSNDAEISKRAKSIVEIIENSLDSLLADYRGYGMPLPPDDAKLVRFESGGRSVVNGNLMSTHSLGFLLRPGIKDKPAVVLVGTQENPLRNSETIEVVEPKAELVKDIHHHGWYVPEPFGSNAGLAIALQCNSRGWNALAQELWASSLKHDSGHRYGSFYQQPNLPNRTAVAYLAWIYSANEMVKPDTDRTKTVKRIKAVLAAEPRLNTEGNQLLLKWLEAALVPSTAKPGSVERMIDDLTDTCNTNRRSHSDEPDPRYSRLSHMGFAAVPALIEHLDDDRLTRSVRWGFNNFPTWPIRVRDVVSDLLQELAGEGIGKDPLRRQQGYAVEKADALAWWDKARKVGEEAYLLDHVLPAGEWPNRLMLELLTKKYPQHVTKIFKATIDDHSDIQIWPIAEAVAKSSLHDDKKRELFLQLAGNKDLERRKVGLSHLQKFDPEQFMEILITTLDSLPKTPTKPYWECPEALYTHLVMRTDDARAWKLLEKVAKRSDVGLRMEFMNPMNYTYIGEKNRKQRLEFLAAFLDDTEVLNVNARPEMFTGPHAGFSLGRLEVRDFAALKIASILELPDIPDKTWTQEQWMKLRNQVIERLKK